MSVVRIKKYAIKFLIYVLIGFAAAFIYRRINS